MHIAIFGATGPRIARPDVAQFLLATLERDAHVHDAPGIRNGPQPSATSGGDP